MVANISSNDTDIALHNRTTGRLEVNGNTKANFLVGSAGKKDVLRGGIGGDTYVVGGASAALVARRSAADDVRVISTSGELDEVVLSSGNTYIEVVYIDGTPAAGVDPRQTTPGELDQGRSLPTPLPTPLPPLPPLPKRPAYGAGTLLTSGVALSPGCVSRLAPPSPAPFLIAAASTDQMPMPSPQAVDAFSPLDSLALGWGCKRKPDQVNEPINSPACRKTACFPGVPALVNMDVSEVSGDRIVLPQEQFSGVLFRGKPITSYKALPLVVVDKIKLEAEPKIIPQDRLMSYLKDSKGLADPRLIPLNQAALIYFSANGLLVLSLNDSPLGSARNPGRVIAQLLDGVGRPVVWRGADAGALLQTSLLSFQPYRPSPPLPQRATGPSGWVAPSPALR